MKFTDFINIIAKWRKSLYFNFLFLTILSIILAFILPKSYIATASFIPTTSFILPSTHLDLYSYIGIRPTPSRFGEVISIGDIFASFLKEEKIKSKVIEKTKLMEKEKIKDLKRAFDWLDDHVKINTTAEGIVEIKVSTKDKNFSVEMANAYIEALMEVTEEFYYSYTNWKMKFLEEAMLEAKENVIRIADSLAKLKKKYNIFIIEREYTSSYQVYSDLKKQEIETEVELKTLQSYNPYDNPQVQKLREKLSNIRNKLKEFEFPQKPMGFGGAFSMPVQKLADVYSLLLRTETEYKAMEGVFSYLSQEYEKAKVEATTKINLINVLSRAKPELVERFPKKGIIIFLGIFVSLVFGILLCFYFEFLENIEKGEEFSEIRNILKEFKKDISFKKKG
ncbi:MAG: hypothetical protein ABIM60_04440 [candidate division WOR-3 bacterium]